MIAAQDIQKIYRDDGAEFPALRNISLQIRRGEFVAIRGPSGSGKSTLLHLLSFLDRPTAGRYTFDQWESGQLADGELAQIRNRQMGFVFQSFNLLGNVSVFENVELPLLYNREVKPRQRAARVAEAVRVVGLEEKLWVEAGRLSGGQKQRVAIARALVNDPEVLFADEPTGNLDSVSGKQIMEILHQLHRAGRTIILVTHETYTAAYAERVITLKDGLIESDKRAEAKNGRRLFKK